MKPGTFRLVPPVERQSALRRDDQAMRDMYLTKPTSFDDILATLAEKGLSVSPLAEMSGRKSFCPHHSANFDRVWRRLSFWGRAQGASNP